MNLARRIGPPQSEMENRVIQHALVSIIINCFNGEKYLRQALESVFSQTYRNFEVIFWDNQSTDGSAEIVDSFNDVRLKYYYAPVHTKLYEARKLAVEKSTGQYLAFLDVDDTWEATKLEKQVPLFNEDEVGIVCGNFWVENIMSGVDSIRRDFLMGQVPEGYVFDNLLSDYFVGLLTLVIRKSAYQSLDSPFDGRYNIIGDFDLVLRLSRSWKLRCVREPIATYRLHGANLSYVMEGERFKEIELWLVEMERKPGFLTSIASKELKAPGQYRKLVHSALSGDKHNTFLLWKSLPIGYLKARGFLILIIPTFIIRFLIACKHRSLFILNGYTKGKTH